MSSELIFGKAFLIFVWINFLDRKIGPIISNSLPPTPEDILNPKTLNKEKKNIININ
jgi:hypothetical protein